MTDKAKRTIPPRIHESLRATFVPLPSDPSVSLTPEELAAVFPHPEAWQEMIDRTIKLMNANPAESGDAA